MWGSIEDLRGLSHFLMLTALGAAIVAALATGARFYVDRRIGELSGHAQRDAEQKRKDEFEAKLGQEREARNAAEAKREVQHRSEVANLQTQLDKAKQAREITLEKRTELLACLKAQNKEGGVFVRPA